MQKAVISPLDLRERNGGWRMKRSLGRVGKPNKNVQG